MIEQITNFNVLISFGIFVFSKLFYLALPEVSNIVHVPLSPGVALYDSVSPAANKQLILILLHLFGYLIWLIYK